MRPKHKTKLRPFLTPSLMSPPTTHTAQRQTQSASLHPPLPPSPPSPTAFLVLPTLPSTRSWSTAVRGKVRGLGTVFSEPSRLPLTQKTPRCMLPSVRTPIHRPLSHPTPRAGPPLLAHSPIAPSQAHSGAATAWGSSAGSGGHPATPHMRVPGRPTQMATPLHHPASPKVSSPSHTPHVLLFDLLQSFFHHWNVSFIRVRNFVCLLLYPKHLTQCLAHPGGSQR